MDIGIQYRNVKIRRSNSANFYIPAYEELYRYVWLTV